MTRWTALFFLLGVLIGIGFVLASAVERQAAATVLLVRAGDGRCWRAHHARVEADGDALSWRTDGSGLRVRVVGADWIEVVRGGGVNDLGLDWRAAAATLGVDLARCLPVAESAP